MMTWIDEDLADDSTSIQMGLWDDDKTRSTRYTFAAAIMAGSVVIWDSKNSPGDSNSVQMAILSVDRIHSACYALAAVLKDGIVVMWDSKDYNGNTAVQKILEGADGKWVKKNYGGYLCGVQTALLGVSKIYSVDYAFTALLKS